MTQYLILHKVRGEPSFDCAEEIELDGEIWWITNSGYRAYPYWKKPLSELDETGQMMLMTVPDDWPDHFEVREPAPANKISDIASFVRGLLPKVKVHRRF